MNDSEFAALSDKLLEHIESALESCIDTGAVDLDFERAASGVLEIEFADGSKIIVNKHAIAREIWVAARSGGFHFRYNGNDWIDTRDGEQLLIKLSHLASEQAGEALSLS